jgi:hypothetical protein
VPKIIHFLRERNLEQIRMTKAIHESIGGAFFPTVDPRFLDRGEGIELSFPEGAPEGSWQMQVGSWESFPASYSWSAVAQSTSRNEPWGL